MSVAAFRGSYTADRASALSGVPRSTVHYWARKEILVPSVSASKIKVWSYTDLMALRTIYWLRRRKISEEGSDIPASTMPAIRKALYLLAGLDLDLWTVESGPSVLVDPNGELYVNIPETGIEAARSGLRPLDNDAFDLIAPLRTRTLSAPDLHAPRPTLRILPGKLSGAPHIANTRIETLAISALAERGFDTARIERLYPKTPPVALVEAIDLERQLSANVRAAAA
jgi:uncharacterized protein (DUF433 family)